jgi:hypothetical protein
MSYQLYRVGGIDETAATGEYLGCYTDYETALHVRDDDVVALLGDVDAAPLLACHRIIGPGLAGPATDHLVVSSVGREGLPATVEAVEAELLDTRRWLRSLRRSRDRVAIGSVPE